MLVSAEEDAQVAALADAARVEFSIRVGAVVSHLDAARLVVAIFAQPARVVLLVRVLAHRHLLLNLSRVVLLGARARLVPRALTLGFPIGWRLAFSLLAGFGLLATKILLICLRFGSSLDVRFSDWGHWLYLATHWL